MLFTIPRRWYSSLPQITVQIDASFEGRSHGARVGAAVRAVLKTAAAEKTRAVLTGAVLTGAVLTGVPIIPKIDSAIFEAITEGDGELDMSTWHTCETTHCRAGWAVALAGAPGKALEDKHGSAAAGALIYAASRPGERVPNFYASDEAALADIKACAERQQAQT